MYAGAVLHVTASKTAQTEYEVAERKEGWYPFIRGANRPVPGVCHTDVIMSKKKGLTVTLMKKYYLKDCESAVR